jgi:hypothetical protein
MAVSVLSLLVVGWVLRSPGEIAVGVGSVQVLPNRVGSANRVPVVPRSVGV